MSSSSPTAAEAWLNRLADHGVDYVFGNAGTDFAPLIESLAEAHSDGVSDRAPSVVPVSHETVAVGMAHGYYLATERPQVVMVHVNVGLANALMGIINASRENIPMLVASGRTPISEQGRFGSRDLPIHWGQEMFDQGEMVRQFTRWDYELRYPDQAPAIVDRALALAQSPPGGPTYVSLPREVLAARLEAPVEVGPVRPAPTRPAPDPSAVDRVAALMEGCQRPVLVTSRADHAAQAALSDFVERHRTPVVQFWPGRLSLATTSRWNGGFDHRGAMARADLIIVLDTMVPWIPQVWEPSPDVPVVAVGPDPMFTDMAFRGFPAQESVSSDVSLFLTALGARLDSWAGRWDPESVPSGPPSADPLGAAVAEVVDSSVTLVNELGCDPAALRFGDPRRYFSHPVSGGLGWGLPCALGVKAARPALPVVAVVGDGSYLFANPLACHQTATALGLPVVTVVKNNSAWDAVRKSTRGMYPEGAAVSAAVMPLSSLSPSPDYDGAVEACGGRGFRVADPGDLSSVLATALEMSVAERVQVVIDVDVR